VIEDIEHLQAKLYRTAFREIGHLMERHVVVVDAGAIEGAAFGVARCSERVRRESMVVEVRLAATRLRFILYPVPS
jgi:hypothetical protein